MAMELRVSEYTMPSEILFNFDELKRAIAAKVEDYKNLVYTDDQIKIAKADKADLNRLKKALNDERLRREKEYMMPFNAFKGKINELIALIDAPIQMIDMQIKAADEKRKAEKRTAIEKIFEDVHFPDFVTLDKIADPRWLNVTFTEAQIFDAMAERCYTINNDLRTINSLPDFAFEALEVYKETLDLNRAISEGQRLAEIQLRKKKEEAKAALEQATIEQAIAEKPQYEAVPIPPKPEQAAPEIKRQWVKFAANLTMQDAADLRTFFKSRNIEFRPI